MTSEKETFQAPKPGDTVNYVTSWKGAIVPAKVLVVHSEHEGRLVTLEVPGKTQNADGDEIATLNKIPVTYRPKSKPAGNTWHHALIAGLLLLALSASAKLFF